MHLNGLIALAENLPEYESLTNELWNQRAATTASIQDAAKPLALAALWRQRSQPVLVVTPSSVRAKRLYEELAYYLGQDDSLQFLPEPDFLPYERLASEKTTIQQRLSALGVLAGLVTQKPPLVIGSAYAIAARTIHPDQFREATHLITCGSQLDLMKVLSKWEALGYQMESSAETPGSASHRGGILDIFPPTFEKPARIELLGDTVESIRLFDPTTQRSEEQIQSILVPPAFEMLPPLRTRLWPTRIQGLSAEAKVRFQEDLERLAVGQRFDEMEFYGPLLNSSNVLDYLGSNTLLVVDEPRNVQVTLEDLGGRADELKTALIKRREIPKNFPSSLSEPSKLSAQMASFYPQLRLESFTASTTSLNSFPFSPAKTYGGRTRLLLQELQHLTMSGQRVVIVTQQAPRLAELFREATLPFQQPDNLDYPPNAGSISLLHASLAEGWSLPSQGTVLLTDAEVFGIKKQHRYPKKRSASRQPFLSNLSVGDYVVHADHGVGRFTGTTVKQETGRDREYLVLEYSSDDRLFVPADQIDRVGPYVGTSDKPPSLTRLGTQEWNRLKERAKASTAQVAKDLLKIYAARELSNGHSFAADTPWQQELEASFPYVETTDQLRTISEIKADMEAPKPMDRLVAGDVGYGKTEVALRAAFKAVMDGMQVAILVPTTVLAQQHFNTFSERLAAFPVKVGMLSRFKSEKEQDEIVQGLAGGFVDICIGTHRLIQKDVSIKNLGLVIVDEEQRFGVAHKEKLKAMRREVDVLSLSATPIPRTLYMALAGVRDMSVMETPPEDRLPTKTYVSEFDDQTIREAILRELERGGQVYFVHNRVRNIGLVAERIRNLVPEAELLIGHGQMPEATLENVMVNFARGEADVLVSTTIIESGIDLPNVNTLIVNDADLMGLSQLYQIRGRVGRSANRAYAYFLYKPKKQITETAEKRLKTILSATELGSGFQIAMRDLEIRGAGNLLGVEQHGQIAAVGLDLYVRMLGQTVEELKIGSDPGLPRKLARPSPTIDLPTPAHIPEDYVSDLRTRLSLYQRMTKINESHDIDDLAAELKDRFGPWPEPVEDLLFMLKVKLLALRAGVLSISHQTGELVVTGDAQTWSGLLGIQRPYGDGVRIGNTRVRLDIKKLGSRWRDVLQSMLAQIDVTPVKANIS